MTTKTFETYWGAVNVQDYGWLPDGTDRSTQALAALAAVDAAGGGTLWFPASAGYYRADSQLLIPTHSSGGAQNYQNNIRFQGSGGGQVWGGDVGAGFLPQYTNASVLDLRYHASDGNAKIESRGLGTLKITDLTLFDGGSTNATPFIHATNTCLAIRDNTFIGCMNAAQDAVVLGGTGSSAGNALNDMFQGYGTIIDGNHFARLNRGLYARAAANSITFSNNSFQRPAGTVAITIDGTVLGAVGNFISNNIIEMATTYVHGIDLINAYSNFFINNGMYDMGGSAAFSYYLQDACYNNVFISGWNVENVGTKCFGDNGGGYYMKLNTIIGPFNNYVAPQLQQSSTTVASLNVPSGTAPTSPNDGDFWYDGSNLKFRLGGTTKTLTWT